MSSTFSCHTVSMAKSVDTNLCSIAYIQEPVFLVQIDLEVTSMKLYVVNGELDPLAEQVACPDDSTSSVLSIPYHVVVAVPRSTRVRYLEQEFAVSLKLDPSSCRQVASKIDAFMDTFPLPSSGGGFFLKADVQVLHQDVFVIDKEENAAAFISDPPGSELQKVKDE